MTGGEREREGEEEEKREEIVMDISLKDLSRKLEEFAKARDWEEHHSPRNLLLAMAGTYDVWIGCHAHITVGPTLGVVGEVGELSEIFQWKGEVARGLPNWEESDKEHLGEELSDVLLYLVRLADICGIDLGDAVSKKIIKNATKYPPKLL